MVIGETLSQTPHTRNVVHVMETASGAMSLQRPAQDVLAPPPPNTSKDLSANLPVIMDISKMIILEIRYAKLVRPHVSGARDR
jgi:hypothetical protein